MWSKLLVLLTLLNFPHILYNLYSTIHHPELLKTNILMDCSNLCGNLVGLLMGSKESSILDWTVQLLPIIITRYPLHEKTNLISRYF